MNPSSLLPPDDLLLNNSIEVGASQEAFAQGNKKIPDKRKGGSIYVPYYRTRRRTKYESFNFPDLSFFDTCNNFQDHVTLNHEAQVGDVMFSDCPADNLGSITTTDLVDNSADGCHKSVQNDYTSGSMREDGSYKLAENVCPLLRDSLMDFFYQGIEPKDDAHMHRGESDDSSAVTEVEYASLPDSLLSFSDKAHIVCNLNTEDTFVDIPNSQLLDSPENVLEDPSLHGDEQDICPCVDDVESTSISNLNSIQPSEGKIICLLNTEDPEIPCNTATDSIDHVSSEFDAAHPHIGSSYESILVDHNPSIPDHNNSDSDNDLSSFTDIEALILKLDFEYAQESWISNEDIRRRHKYPKRTVNTLEQSLSQRAMSALGAFAVFYSHHVNYYIKKTEVTIGRSTDDTEVDIDLRKESHANMISRQQAIIKMETDGTFTLKNIGKGSIITKGISIAHGQVAVLSSSCLIQIRGMDFMFEINDIYVRWYLDNIVKKTQGKCFEEDTVVSVKMSSSRKKSERIAKIYTFNKFNNTADDPIELDDSLEQTSNIKDKYTNPLGSMEKNEVNKGGVDEYVARRRKTLKEKINIIKDVKENFREINESMMQDEAKKAGEASTNVDHNVINVEKGMDVEKSKTSSDGNKEVEGSIKGGRFKSLCKRKIIGRKRSSANEDPMGNNETATMTIKKMKRRKLNRKGKGVVESKIKDEMKQRVTMHRKWFGIRTRSSPKQFYTAVSQLNKMQKQAVVSMGFGRLLKLKVDGIPSKLGHFVVDMLDPVKLKIRTTKGDVNVDKEAIYRLIGIPKGDIGLLSKDNKGKTEDYSCWRARYGGVNVSPSEIVDKILEGDYDDYFHFKLDFLVLFYNTMVVSRKNGRCLCEVVKHMTMETNFKDYDWCGCIEDVIKKCKENWTRCNLSCDFVGPLTILTLLYVDCVMCPGFNCDKTMSPLAFWNMEKLKKREEHEILKVGGFGMGELTEQYVDDEEYEVESDDDTQRKSKTENDDDDSLGFDNETLEGNLGLLESIKSINMEGKLKFENALRAAKKLFPASEEVNKYQKIYQGLYRYPEDIEDVGSQNVDIHTPKNLKIPIHDPQVWTQLAMDVSEIVEFESAQKDNDKALKDVNFECPSYSLGLTQEFMDISERFKTSNIGKEVCKDVDINMKLNKSVAGKGKRVKQPSTKYVSPFINRPVDMKRGMSKEEMRIWNYLMSGIVDESKFEELKKLRVDGELVHKTIEEVREAATTFNIHIFATKKWVGTNFYQLNSLTPGQQIYNDVIDCWAKVLNHDEKDRCPSSPYRLFVGVTPFLGWIIESDKETDAERIEHFKTNLESFVEDFEGVFDIKKFDIIFFPILEKNHFYLVCFEMKDAKITVIDNMSDSQCLISFDDDAEFIKKGTPLKVKHIFVSYLKSVEHPKWREIESAYPQKLRIGWSTSKNSTDCGIFVMRHMEMFMGSRSKKWDCGFPSDESKMKTKIRNMRKKYAVKILTSDVNIYKEKVLKEAEELDQTKKR